MSASRLRIDESTATFRLSALEIGASETVVAGSQQTHLKLLPNHHMNEELELAGFHFTCNASDLASVMPVPKTLFACTAMYEVRASEGSAFNACVLHVLAKQEETRAALEGVVARLRGHECREAPGFDCIADEAEDERVEGVLSFLTHCRTDRRTWAEQVPSKVGLYHAFVRKSTKDRMEHKLFIIVSGSLAHADEELFRAWQDSCTNTTCAQFVSAEETEWLRAASVRNLNRVAAMVAEALELPVMCVIDTEDPTRTKRAAHPTTVTFENDILLDTDRNCVHLVNGGCFVERSENGVLFRMNSSEGYWLFCGPTDNASGQPYGSVFNSSERSSCFPTKTVQYNDKFAARGAVVSCKRSDNAMLLYDEEDTGVYVSLFPEEQFLRNCTALGFNRNNGIIHLMPILTYASQKTI
jgi:hypothetical protein